MKIHPKRLLSLMLVIVMLVPVISTTGLTVSAATYSGTCGDNLTWTLNTSTGVLEISGKGNMYNYNENSSFPYTSAPWGSYYTNIKEIVIGDSVKSIGNYAFYKCIYLTTVTISDSVTKIGRASFYYCPFLANVSIPKSIASIGDYAFVYCTSLTTVTIPDSVTRIGDEVFSACTSLVSVIIPNSVKSIGNSAFSDCWALKNVNIPDSVTSIGKSAFWNCESLTSVVIPSSVSKIDYRVFAFCSSLISVTIPSSILTIGDQAFFKCTVLENIKYCGSKTDWSKIVIGKDNDYLINATITYDYEYKIIEDGFKFFLNYPSNTLSVGDTVKLYSEYYKDGNPLPGNEKYVYATLDTDIIRIKKVNSKLSYIEVTALKEGLATITVTEPNEQVTAKIEIGITAPEGVFTFYNLPKMNIEQGKVTNFYNYYGMVIDDFSFKEHKNNSGKLDYYIVTMNVYNSHNLYGAVTAYDVDGKIYSYKVIDKMESMETSFVDSCVMLTKQIGDLWHHSKNPLFYSGEATTKQTKVTVNVPVGGRLTISNSMKTSEVCAVANAGSLIYDLACWSIDLTKTDVSSDRFKGEKYKIIEKIAQESIDANIQKNILQIVKNYAKGYNTKTDNPFELANDINGAVLTTCDYDLLESVEFAITNTLSIAESVFVKMLPTGAIIDILYSMNEFGNIAIHLKRIQESCVLNDDIIVYASPSASEYTTNGVVIESSENYKESVVHSYEVTDVTEADIDDSLSGKYTFLDNEENYVLYDITLYTNGEKAQPSAPVTVKIPLPANFNKTATKVYRYNDDGTMTDMRAKYENGYMVFETNHFCYFFLADESVYVNPFTDVKDSHWFASSVEYCVKAGYVKGMTEKTFVPNGKLTRAQFLTMLAGLDGVDLTQYDTTESGFTDVKVGHWYNEVVCWAVKEGITSGISATKFGPNNNVTRAQVARFFYVYSEINGIDVDGKADLTVYPDSSKVQPWAKEPTEWAVSAGLISGVAKNGINYLDPNGTATRAQATVMFRGFDDFRK